MSEAITPFHLDVPEAALDDLRVRLANTRWPERETVGDWGQGVPLDRAQALVAHWRDRYDWRACEARLNALGQYRTTIDGTGIHFLHVRSPERDALPLIITHGWPGSVVEFLKVIGPLTDPAAHGGDPRDAFHIVAPSLPGYAFSDRPADRWPVPRIAAAWITLMKRLGYDRFVAQGGDWGSAVSSAIGASGDAAVAGIHVNMIVAPPTPDDMADPTPEEQAALAAFQRYMTDGNGYAQQQATRPQTLGYALVDSPAGQAAWIFEKFHAWTDCDGDPLNVLTLDEIIDNIMLYWLPGTAASAARLYWESFRDFAAARVEVPVACSLFPKEILRASRRWAERRYPQIVHWGEPARGGHFAAFEQPGLFVEEVRAGFRPMR
ncbi:epoxide hydrolase family protein [Sphingomonas lycopersici]|uniref:Epoxide hydrolase 1 n=1 Tax=Sphingomonas lycopersici TaxID=2951807 RepID=A0AA42CVY4_9SPHN|nr:epoxide hydrolase [Sphingomonas lycopersici]MCW6537183.1 epoxide hydrolase 1 [Sphingomonas lycopersici]